MVAPPPLLGSLHLNNIESACVW